MLITQEITVIITTYNQEYYSQKLQKSLKYGEKITIPIDLLAPFSQKKVVVQCDYCGKVYEVRYCKISQQLNDICCSDCKIHKIHKTMLERYGTTQNTLIPQVQEKIKQNSLKKYGTEQPMNSKQSREKAKITNLKKYGVEFPLQNQNILQKINKNSGIPISKNQKIIFNLLGGQINYQIDKYFVDVFTPDGICFEYDGGGHTKAVIMGRLSLDEFYAKEKQRDEYIISQGYKIFRFRCPDDKLPNIGLLKQIYCMGKDLLQHQNKIIFDNSLHCFIFP